MLSFCVSCFSSVIMSAGIHKGRILRRARQPVCCRTKAMDKSNETAFQLDAMKSWHACERSLRIVEAGQFAAC